jgi:hypothetical protein
MDDGPGEEELSDDAESAPEDLFLPVPTPGVQLRPAAAAASDAGETVEGGRNGDDATEDDADPCRLLPPALLLLLLSTLPALVLVAPAYLPNPPKRPCRTGLLLLWVLLLLMPAFWVDVGPAEAGDAA